MKITMFGWTLEVYLSKPGTSRRLAGQVLNRSYLVAGGTNGRASRKIQLIKALRIIDESLGLKEAKEAVEAMFDIAEDGTTTIK